MKMYNTTYMVWREGFWFRILGYGLHVKRARDHVKLFSERGGYRKALYACGLRIEALKP